MSKIILILILLLLPSPVSAKQVYPLQLDCEKDTGKICAFIMCDYIPEGKTFEEVCGKDFQKGWQATDKPLTQKGVIVYPNEQVCAVDSDCVRVSTVCSGCECGVPVNTEYKEKYIEHYKEICQDYSGPVCEFDCPTPYPKCLNNICTLTAFRNNPNK